MTGEYLSERTAAIVGEHHPFLLLAAAVAVAQRVQSQGSRGKAWPDSGRHRSAGDRRRRDHQRAVQQRTVHRRTVPQDQLSRHRYRTHLDLRQRKGRISYRHLVVVTLSLWNTSSCTVLRISQHSHAFTSALRDCGDFTMSISCTVKLAVGVIYSEVMNERKIVYKFYYISCIIIFNCNCV